MLAAGQKVNKDRAEAADSRQKPLCEIFADSRVFLDDLVSFALETAGLYRSGREMKANEFFLQAVEGLEFLTACIIHIGNLTESTRESGFEKAVNGLNVVLMEMVASQEKSDWVLLADLLEYELVPILRQWNGIFALMESNASV